MQAMNGQQEMPWPARQQEEHGDEDLKLLELARENHPEVRWWWNQRTEGRLHGAYCYICDLLIETWARRWPMTWRAKRAVEEHRRQHIERLGKGRKDG